MIRRFQRQWDAAARDVRAALAAVTVEMVDRTARDMTAAGAPRQQIVEATARIWTDMTDLMYPTTKETHS